MGERLSRDLVLFWQHVLIPRSESLHGSQQNSPPLHRPLRFHSHRHRAQCACSDLLPQEAEIKTKKVEVHTQRICRHNGFFMFKCNTIFITVQPWVQGERVCLHVDLFAVHAVCVFVVQSATRTSLQSVSCPCWSLGERRWNVRPPSPRSDSPTHPPWRAIMCLCFCFQGYLCECGIFLLRKLLQTLNFNKSEKCAVFIKNLLLL